MVPAMRTRPDGTLGLLPGRGLGCDRVAALPHKFRPSRIARAPNPLACTGFRPRLRAAGRSGSAPRPASAAERTVPGWQGTRTGNDIGLPPMRESSRGSES
jgi:hypothetical protein